LLSPELRAQHRLVIASEADETLRAGLLWKASTFGLSSEDLIVTGYVPNDELIDLYRACGAYVFPSLHEGFGLPVLEAMACGAVVIASNCTSIPEAHGLPDALFDPTDPISISNKMKLALTDEDFRARLKLHATRQLPLFSWDRSARIACKAIENLHERLINTGWCRTANTGLPSEDEMLAQLASMNLAALPNTSDLQAFSKCLHQNQRSIQ
jgi:glycosyltransferase involved in cell wall biosynthesis